MKRLMILASVLLLLTLSSCKEHAIPDDSVQKPDVDQSIIEDAENGENLDNNVENTDEETESTNQEKEDASQDKEDKEDSTEESEENDSITTDIHSALYIPDIPVEDVIEYFNEICLDGEFINSGDPSFVQKWVVPIAYTLEGEYTAEDIETIDAFAAWLNDLDGFPGIYQTDKEYERNLRICFVTQDEMLALMGDNFVNMDGAVTFWYADDVIYNAIICYRTDLNQEIRNSVILEEIYNGLGPIQDTNLRSDSIIYQAFSQPQWLSTVDGLILQLLYHPDIQPGMNAQECEQVIRSLYY